MRLAVISDTHLHSPEPWLERVYNQWLAPADVLVHCGDITTFDTWSFFMQHDRFLCVRGNCDWEPRLVEQLDPMLTAQVGPLTIAATHGWGPRSQVPVKVAQAFGPEYDLVCYGHTHAQDWSVIEGVQLLNPGSLGESRSLAIVTISDDGAMDCEFIDAS
ncbi:Phosphoesterase [Pseudodesulfovibrio profundus]|uniref:Phosphoesterase n=1 Tax=Pseudodesulfovibrio profundus TaxID=57320 RepID=A0A2C8FAD3_9BACT|nr:YfcE family phosphodiesterase [Pseudodesulfovibrio profundus]MBC15981.1 YfcE family phosphodiesterase [Desulfovibrio sp.]SOB59395.1 Phosphoesterase [Pseudodesulfovibrio profundus]|tara:strand:- start:4744 stop:5223 length:480 start_codon:yes stop_codon:yes gene_type:complete